LTDSKILKTLSHGSSGRSSLLSALGYKNPTGNFKKSISHLLSSGLIEMTLPDKPNSRLQKYRLTAKGRQALAAKGKRS
jgi:ATP-dependent DNA helicase RecG